MTNSAKRKRRRLAERIAAGVPLRRGTVTMATVRHDAWCPTLTTGRSDDCACDPEIELQQYPSPRRPGG